MTSFSKTTLLLGVAMVALSACGGTKGPGDIGTKNDIVVRNHGEPAPAPATTDVLAAPDSALIGEDPAMDAAAQELADQNAPVPPTTAAPMGGSDVTDTAAVVTSAESPANPIPDAPVMQDDPLLTARQSGAVSDEPAPVAIPDGAPVTAPAAAPVTAPAPQPVTAPAPATTIVESHGTSMILPADAPESARAVLGGAASSVAAPTAEAPAPAQAAPSFAERDYSAAPETQAQVEAQPPVTAPAPVAASQVNLFSPDTVKSVQEALKAKGLYNGTANGIIDTNFLNVLAKYQGDNNLPLGGINLDTMRHLGLVQ